ncbi:uncharacterized protein LOC141489525 [Macrotis lagotis]|uniref:uncharacterized protein LOC141489525 n=1 Tax=Macrotis lagotis TaxID=92651 RepID=UPI003D68CA79
MPRPLSRLLNLIGGEPGPRNAAPGTAPGQWGGRSPRVRRGGQGQSWSRRLRRAVRTEKRPAGNGAPCESAPSMKPVTDSAKCRSVTNEKTRTTSLFFLPQGGPEPAPQPLPGCPTLKFRDPGFGLGGRCPRCPALPGSGAGEAAEEGGRGRTGWRVCLPPGPGPLGPCLGWAPPARLPRPRAPAGHPGAHGAASETTPEGQETRPAAAGTRDGGGRRGGWGLGESRGPGVQGRPPWRRSRTPQEGWAEPGDGRRGAGRVMQELRLSREQRGRGRGGQGRGARARPPGAPPASPPSDASGKGGRGGCPCARTASPRISNE